MAVASDIGPLDWQTPIVDGTGRPSPEFQRRWNAQRSNNALIGSVTTGLGVPTGTPTDGAEYLDISAVPAVIYIGHAGLWVKSGLRAFIELSDAPSAYTGAAGKLVQVNAGVTGLQFSALSAVLDSLGAAQGDVLYRGASGWVVLPPGTAGQVLSTGGASANPSWIAAGSGGGATYTLPTAASFSWYYQFTGATKTDVAGAVQLAAPIGGGHRVSTITQAAPGSTPWTQWARLTPADNKTATGGNQWFGVAVGDSSGKIVFFGWYGATTAQYSTFNSGSSLNAATNVTTRQYPPLIGINDDGTNLNFLASYDGVSSYVLYSVSRTAWLASGPTQVGVAIDSEAAASVANLAHWSPNLPGPL